MSGPLNFSNLESVLPGTTLNGRWTVGRPTKATPGQTGGCFSITFECADVQSGKPVFLKVVDVNSAIMNYSNTMPIPDIMIKIAEEHKFESNLMNECKEARLHRVVVGLDHGAVQVTGFSGPVLFLVFELAKGDTHKVKSTTPALARGLESDRWWLETLHHVSTGLHHLHQKAIAHQDVKPSNILFFDQAGAKVADLGRSVKKGVLSSNLRKNGDLLVQATLSCLGMPSTETCAQMGVHPVFSHLSATVCAHIVSTESRRRGSLMRCWPC
jgi:serine/threonine protein kinase